jgi:hypothetical protein
MDNLEKRLLEAVPDQQGRQKGYCHQLSNEIF